MNRNFYFFYTFLAIITFAVADIKNTQLNQSSAKFGQTSKRIATETPRFQELEDAKQQFSANVSIWKKCNFNLKYFKT